MHILHTIDERYFCKSIPTLHGEFGSFELNYDCLIQPTKTEATKYNHVLLNEKE
jgi:hypothetical protein